MDADTKEPLLSVATFGEAMTVMRSGHGSKAKKETLCWAGAASYVGCAKLGRSVKGFVIPLQLVVAR